MSINKSYVLAGALVAASSIIMPMAETSQVEAATQTVTVTSRVNFRKGPSMNYSIMRKLYKGYKLTYLGKNGNWIKVKYDGTTGYVYKDYVSGYSSSSDNKGITRYVNASVGLNVRKGPSTSYSKLGKLSYGKSVKVLSTSNGWLKISYNGRTAYVKSTYLQAKKPSSTSSKNDSDTNVSKSASALISYAKKFLGKPYVWGAQGPNSFDCSGFTYYVFKNSANITLPRTSKDQSTYGTTVSKKNLKVGDLVFFDTSGSNSGNVSHVGIYIGSNQFIHASSSKGKVVISDFNNYYTNAFVKAKRVL